MSNFVIPCATVARLAKILKYKHPDNNEWFRSIRLDNGLALASNRYAVIGEKISDELGVTHVNADPALIEACEKEAPFDSLLYLAVNETIRITSAKTTLGYQFPGNAGVFSSAVNDFDRWRSFIQKTTAAKPKGGMFLNAEMLAIIAETSPSGRIVTEEIIDCSRPMIIRDAIDESWFAMLKPYNADQPYQAATWPEWLK